MQHLLERYKKGYEEILHEIEGLQEEQLSYKPNDVSWSIKEVLIHITDAEMVHIHRMKAVLAEENPVLTAFDQDLWAARLQYQHLDPKAYLALFHALRTSFIPILEHLKESEWQRYGTHTSAGKQTFLDILEHAVDHVDGHIEQIQRVKRVLP